MVTILTKVRIPVIAAVLSLCAVNVCAQPADSRIPVRYDTRAEILANPAKAGAESYMLETPLLALTPAPKGYEPFYISHMGRHGARYAYPDDIYEYLLSVFDKAYEENALTSEGEQLRQRFMTIYNRLAMRGGDLSHKGQEQQKEIARRMYADYKNVFKGDTHAEVTSTASPRVIMSMNAFMSEIQCMDKDFDYSVDAGRRLMEFLVPLSGESPLGFSFFPLSEDGQKAADHVKSKVDTDAFARRYFTKPSVVESLGGMFKFEDKLWVAISNFQCLEGVDTHVLGDVFTFDENFAIWETHNFNGYLVSGRSPYRTPNCNVSAYSLEDFIVKADRDIAEGDVNLRLRFSHDTGLLPLVCFMGVNNFGVEIDDPDQVCNYWRSFEIPMGANIQMIFYRSRRSSEILLKVLYNGVEASLPVEPAYPSFYSWDSFKSYYLPVIEEAKATVAPRLAGKSLQ